MANNDGENENIFYRTLYTKYYIIESDLKTPPHVIKKVHMYHFRIFREIALGYYFVTLHFLNYSPSQSLVLVREKSICSLSFYHRFLTYVINKTAEKIPCRFSQEFF